MFKKLVLTIVFFGCLSTIINAQLGIRAALNFSSAKIEVLGINANSDSKVGVHFGLLNDFKLADKIIFRPGVLFSLKGGKTDESSLNYSYIEVPFSLIYNFTGEDSGFFAEAGPYVGLLLAAKSEDDEIKDEFNSRDESRREFAHIFLVVAIPRAGLSAYTHDAWPFSIPYHLLNLFPVRDIGLYGAHPGCLIQHRDRLDDRVLPALSRHLGHVGRWLPYGDLTIHVVLRSLRPQ